MSTGTPFARCGPRALPSPPVGGREERGAHSDEKTAIVHGPQAPEARAWLSFTAGPRAGETLSLPEGDGLVLGRAVDNPISIPDSSVSRRHAALRRVGGGWALRDLGSGNGTLVNGEPLEGECPLAGGDVVTLGDSELRFEDAGDATALGVLAAAPLRAPAPPTMQVVEAVPLWPALPHPRPGVRSARASAAAAVTRPEVQTLRRRRLRFGAPALALALLLALGLGRKLKLDEDARSVAEGAQAAQRARLGSLFQESKRLVREGRWQEAKERLDTLAAAQPDHPGVQDYLERAAKEVPNQARLAEARAALARNALGPAAAALARVTSDTTQYDALRTLRAQLLLLCTQRVAEARRLFDARELEAAQAVAADVLLAFPEERDARLLEAQAARALRLRAAPARVARGPAAKAWAPAVARFVDGDLTGAAALANGCVAQAPRCRQLLAQMEEFSGLYRRLEELDAKGLTRLLQLDREITQGRPSQMARTAGTRAASTFYESAYAAKASGQWGRAGEDARQALQVDPGHAGATNLLSELRTRAKDLYLSAYSLKDTSPDEALPRFREVMQMTLPSDETHEKARGWVEKLSR